MRGRIFVAAGLLLLAAGLAQAADDRKSEDGYWWLMTDESFKVGWVRGFVDGENELGSHLVALCVQKIAAVAGTAQFQRAADSCRDEKDVNILRPPKKPYGQLVDGLDQFYQDYRNKDVPIFWAIGYVYKELNGTSQGELDQYAKFLRDCVEAARVFRP